jgi:hypothetical protein
MLKDFKNGKIQFCCISDVEFNSAMKIIEQITYNQQEDIQNIRNYWKRMREINNEHEIYLFFEGDKIFHSIFSPVLDVNIEVKRMTKEIYKQLQDELKERSYTRLPSTSF